MLRINLTTSSLIAGFECVNSGCRRRYRKILQKRFLYVDWKQQLDILETFSRSPAKVDKKWVKNILNSKYKNSFNIIKILYDPIRAENIKKNITINPEISS